MPVFSGFLGLFEGFNLQQFLITILVLCISLSFHERSHAWAAYKLGDDTAALQGRLSMNPLVHLDPIGSLVFLVSSLSGAGGIGWAKPVPINPTRFDRRFSMKKCIVLTSVAGPLSNMLLSVLSVILFYVTKTIGFALDVSTQQSVLFSILLNLFDFMALANITLGLFNLIPVPPLDGYKVFGAMLPGSAYYRIMQHERIIGLVFLGVVFLFRGALTMVLSYMLWPFNQAIFKPIGLFFNWLWSVTGLI